MTVVIPLWAWLVFAGVVAIAIGLDLLGHRGDRGAGRKHAAVWSVLWVAVALAFGGWVTLQFGAGMGEDYFTAWLLEKSLSIDNLFVFLVVFAELEIPEKEQHRVLFWGILGALVTRGLFIAGGSALLGAWHGVVYPMGALLLLTALKTLRDDPSRGKDSAVLRFTRRHVRYTPRLDGHRFFTLESGRRVATPLLVALVVIEATDVVFAIDSIPAVFSVTREPFIVYSSNMFAVLGLRALYLVLASLLRDLKYLRYGLAAILGFAGLKMVTTDLVQIPHAVSHLAILVILVAAIVPSIIARRRSLRLAHQP